MNCKVFNHFKIKTYEFNEIINGFIIYCELTINNEENMFLNILQINMSQYGGLNNGF